MKKLLIALLTIVTLQAASDDFNSQEIILYSMSYSEGTATIDTRVVDGTIETITNKRIDIHGGLFITVEDGKVKKLESIEPFIHNFIKSGSKELTIRTVMSSNEAFLSEYFRDVKDASSLNGDNKALTMLEIFRIGEAINLEKIDQPIPEGHVESIVLRGFNITEANDHDAMYNLLKLFPGIKRITIEIPEFIMLEGSQFSAAPHMQELFIKQFKVKQCELFAKYAMPRFEEDGLKAPYVGFKSFKPS